MFTNRVYSNTLSVQKKLNFCRIIRETALTLDGPVEEDLPNGVKGPIVPDGGPAKVTLEFASLYSRKRAFNDPYTNHQNHAAGT